MRLIDAEQDVNSYIETWDCHCSENGQQHVMAVDDLQYLPTIDAVPVVRCGECRYWDDDGRCNPPKNGLIREYTEPDDFCSYGERRDEEK